MGKLFRLYLKIPILYKFFFAFILGSIVGGILWYLDSTTGLETASALKTFVAPFGLVFINMLKMIVIPIVFFSLVVGAASLPISKFGRVGVKVIAWYMFTSLLAAVVGVFLALQINPGANAKLEWQSMTKNVATQSIIAKKGGSLGDIFINMFNNPFASLANGDFLPMIVFAILFGLAIRVVMEQHPKQEIEGRLSLLLDIFHAINDAMFKIVDWVLEYAPIGVLALSIVNFALYGPKIVGPYVQVVLGVISGIIVMVFIVYPILLKFIAHQSPIAFFLHIKEAMLTAFLTRSSAATLPVSMRVAEKELGIREEIAGFSLPLGATINMDGVCVHLPFFAVLTANIFGYELTTATLLTLVLTTVLAAVGAGGVPGGSLMLLFIILGSMHVPAAQTATIVALALGINPILDMFETMNNVTGDIMCTYVVASKEGLMKD